MAFPADTVSLEKLVIANKTFINGADDESENGRE